MDVSFFGEMAWKSALISGAALALAYVLRSRAAADRALVLRLGVAMLLLLPFIALALPALQIEAWAAPEPAAPLAYVSARGCAGLSGGGRPAGGGADDLGRSDAARPARLSGRAADGGRAADRRPRHARPLDPAGAPRRLCPEWLAAFEQARAGTRPMANGFG